MPTRFHLCLFACLVVLGSGTQQLRAQEVGLETVAEWQAVPAAGFNGCVPLRQGTQLRLEVTAEGWASREVSVPRLFTSLRSVSWVDFPSSSVEVVPEPTLWRVRWKKRPAEASVILFDCDWSPLLASEQEPIAPAGDGSLLLRACQATTHGEKLRYEPQSFKNTVGFWTKADDQASWAIDVARPGCYALAILQGCGKGQGGSDAVLTISPHGQPGISLPFSPLETGHFQNFRWLDLGTVVLETTGLHELRVKPTKIAKAALCDIRAISLVPQAKAD